MKNKIGWKFDNTYIKLPPVFYSLIDIKPIEAPKLIILNEELALELGLDSAELKSKEGLEILSGGKIPEGGHALAQAYAGHQYGYFTMLGDGRAFLIGEQITPKGKRVDIQLKGSGITPYSRRGDGKAALGPMLREYIISEAMNGLGINTSRSLAVVETGKNVFREKMLPGAVLTRIASSHLRFGTFQYAAAQNQVEYIKSLADYAINRHYPQVLDSENPYIEFLREVINKQAKLIAKWQLVGFVHGVMNTDNMTISGETIDYGPCAFMDNYSLSTVFSSIDRNGRYAFGNQPAIGQWNVARFAETLLPLLDKDEEKSIEIAKEELSKYQSIYQEEWLKGMRKKLGLRKEMEEDMQLIVNLLELMEENKLDYTNTFIDLTFNKKDSEIFSSPQLIEWKEKWNKRLALEKVEDSEITELMKKSNPAVIPRNHRVEEALDLAVNKRDYSLVKKLLEVLKDPFAHSKEQEEYAKLPEKSEVPYITYCGT